MKNALKRHWALSILLITVFTLGTVSGILNQKYSILRVVYDYLRYGSTGAWSIGIYEGSNPFDLEPAKGVINPVLTAKDVTDGDAIFLADPFMIRKGQEHYMFFEVMNRKPKEGNQGDIGYAQSSDGKHWEYKKMVLDEPFHLAYPYVFEWNGDYYLIPETSQDLSVSLYKANVFPDQWEYQGALLNGYRYVDPSIFRHQGKWWLFVTTPASNVLNLYYANDLLGEWKPHPMNPLVKFDRNIARPGGRVITYDNRLFRITQDDEPSYGLQVFAFEITELSETSYQERIVSEKPLVTMTGKGWNAAGMHHVDLHQVGEKWMAVVDGRNR
jgi:hypothetical protein